MAGYIIRCVGDSPKQHRKRVSSANLQATATAGVSITFYRDSRKLNRGEMFLVNACFRPVNRAQVHDVREAQLIPHREEGRPIVPGSAGVGRV